MSVTSTVLITRTKLPARDVWAAAIRSRGFDMELDHFDVATHEGFLPCRYRGREAGFEYSIQSTADYFAEQEVATDDVRRSAGRDTAVSFVTHSDMAGLATATIAGVVLAMIADGVLWNGEADELVPDDELLEYARVVLQDIDASFAKLAVMAKPAARSVAANIQAKVVFRGSALFTIETCETPPRRFTVKTVSAPAPGDAATIVALWEHPAGRATVHEVRLGVATYKLEPTGVPIAAESSIPELVARLGVTESATRALIAAGASAVPALCETASKITTPIATRRMAIVILGQIRDASAITTLSALVDHPELAATAQRAIRLIQR